MAKTDDDVLATARKRFERCQSYYSVSREKQRDDIRFEAASPDDPWQWPESQRKSREQSGRPCLTINKLPQHANQVLNDIRQNRPSIRYRAAGGKATAEVADILTGLSRHIEAISDADVAYDAAARGQVIHGEGYIRVLTQYVDERSFDQDIFIAPIRDPFKVYLDPSAEDPAGADARFAFIAEEIDEDEFKAQYPDADAVDWDFDAHGDWFTSDHKVRVAEYLTLESKPATLLMWGNGESSYEGDKMPPGVFQGEMPVRKRKVDRSYVCWRKITGNQILEKVEYNWRYIPLARVVGNDRIVDGRVVVSGLIRNAKDAQRQYNLSQSAITERVMLAPKTPWLVAHGAKEGFEDQWETANSVAYDALTYNHVDDNGTPIPTPSRTQPATIEPGLQQLMMMASDDIKSTTGQYDASLGQKSNETSGRAIMARQREGDTATYHYVDNLGRSVRHIGRIILDMLPTVYDTARVARILGEDESESFAQMDPESPEALQETKDADGKTQRIFNPSVGVYDVVTTTGPSFTTRRVEAAQAMSEMTQANPSLWGVIGDLLVQNMDWPGAHEMGERLKLTLIPTVQAMLDKDGGEQEIPPQLKAQMDQMQQTMQQMDHALQAAEEKLKDREAQEEKAEADMLIGAYNAVTNRLKVVPPITPEQIQALVQQTVEQAMYVPPIEPEELQDIYTPEAQEQPESPQEQPEQGVSPQPEVPTAPVDPSMMSDAELLGALK